MLGPVEPLEIIYVLFVYPASLLTVGFLPEYLERDSMPKPCGL